MTIAEGFQVANGLGSKGQLLSTTTDPHLLQALWCAIWTYHLSMGFCRLSVVAQCLRIFPQASHGWVRWMMWFLAASNGVNMIWAFLSTTLTCIPAEKYWHVDLPGHCFNRTVLYMTNSALAMVLDVAVAILPISWIGSLRLPLRQKVLLSGIFILAGFPCVLAAIRVQALIEVTLSEGTNYTDGILAIFSCAEVYAAIICACLPTLKACWSHLRPSCIRRSHMICHWLPCSSCEYFSPGSISVTRQRLKVWRQGRRHRSNEGSTIHESRVQEEGGEPHPGQEHEVQAPRQVTVRDLAKSTVQTVTEEEAPAEVQWRETTTAVRRLGVLPSMAGGSDTAASPTATRLGVLPSVAGYSGTTFVSTTAGSTEPG